jgi:hypothetical protein
LHPDKYLLVVVGNQAQMPTFAQTEQPSKEKEMKHEIKSK